MTTLHMEVPTARSVQQKMQTTHAALQDQLQQMASAVSQLEAGAWQGQSAQQFYTEFHTWRQEYMRLLQRLNELAQALSREITEWEQMAQRLS